MRIEPINTTPLVPRGEFPGGVPEAGPERGPAGIGSDLQPPTAGGAVSSSFSQVLGRALGEVNGALRTADAEARQVATGEANNLHDSLLAMAEADLALQVTMRVTQKAIAAYQEISRMQI